MKPKLFPSDATSFDWMGFGVLAHALTCEVTEDLGQAPTLTMTMLDTDPLFNHVTIGNMVVCQANKYDEQQAFVIEEVTKNIADEVSVYATHIAQHRGRLIPVAPFTATTLDNALTQLNSNSLETNPFSLVRDSGKNNVSATMTVQNPTSFRELLGGVEGSVLDVYRGEWHYNNFTLTLFNKRGHDNGVRVMYRKNMTEFNLDENFSWSDSPTGAIGFWRKEETLVQSAIQYSSLSANYPYKKTVVVDFSDKFEDAPTVADLNTLTSAWINGKGNPTINMEVAFNHLAFDEDATIELGDIVHIINPNYNVNTTRRIVGLVYDVLADEYKTITIGDLKTTLNDAIYEAAGTDSISSVPYSAVSGIAEKSHTSEVADALLDPNQYYKIQARYGGSEATPQTWLPMYQNLGGGLIELSPVSKTNFAQSCIRTFTASISWTLSSSGGVYAYQFNPNTLWGIPANQILSIGMTYYSGAWRFLNFYPYGPTNDEQWVVISNQASVSGTIKVYFVGERTT